MTYLWYRSECHDLIVMVVISHQNIVISIIIIIIIINYKTVNNYLLQGYKLRMKFGMLLLLFCRAEESALVKWEKCACRF